MRNILDNLGMICSDNEKYLLKFISDTGCSSNTELLRLIVQMGIKLNFKNNNPVYQIIDELNYQEMI